MIQISAYRYGGGSRGNVGKNTLTVLKSSIPYIAAVTNRRAATGGLDQESVENAILRGPGMFRTRNRAVTESDFEFLALEASPSVARAKCVQPRESTSGDGPPPGVVLLLLIPLVSAAEGRIPPEQFALPQGLKHDVQRYLDERRLLSTLLVMSEPKYCWVSVEAKVRIKSQSDPLRVRESIEKELYRFINPLRGGPQGNGWPFGRDLVVSEIYSHIQSVAEVEYVEEAHIYQIDISTGKRGQATTRLVLPQTGVICSHEHRIIVEQSGEL
jgi:predicted phage baseplate assembly protein